MTDREDAVMLADDIEIYGLHNDEERGWFLSSEGERLIVSALRAYAAEPVTPAALRKKIAAAIRSYAPQENADAAFRVIHDGGFVLVPREPTEAMIEAAWLASSTWGIGEAAGQWFVSDTHAGGSTVVMIGSRDGAVAEMNGRNTAASIRAALAAEEKSP